MPPVLAVPTAVLVLVAAATWRLDRRLRADAARLEGATARLASLRSALAELGSQVDDATRRHGELSGYR